MAKKIWLELRYFYRWYHTPGWLPKNEPGLTQQTKQILFSPRFEVFLRLELEDAAVFVEALEKAEALVKLWR